YFNFETHLYFKELFLIGLPTLMQFSILALFLQTVLPNKFLGHALVIGYFILLEGMTRYEFENPLYQFANLSDYTYSVMNGYGPFIRPILWLTLYWVAFAGALGVVTVTVARRGADLDWRSRSKQAARRFRFPANAVGAAFVLAFVAIGG